METIQYKTTNKYNQEVIDEIVRVEKEIGLTAENLLEVAKNQDNPLHNFFEWNNSKAGEKWRVQQARMVINEVKIIVGNKEMYAFENVKINVIENDISEEPQFSLQSSRVYKPKVEVMTNEEYRQQMILSALNNLLYWKERHQEYSELKPIFISIDKVKKELDKKWQKKKQ